MWRTLRCITQRTTTSRARPAAASAPRSITRITVAPQPAAARSSAQRCGLHCTAARRSDASASAAATLAPAAPASAAPPSAAAELASATPAAAVYTVSELIRALQTRSVQLPLPAPAPATAAADAASPSSPAAAVPPPVVVRLRGWVRSARASKLTCFLLLNDGTHLASVQCILDTATVDALPGGATTLATGCSVDVTGKLVWTHKAEAALQKLMAESAAAGSLTPVDPLHHFAPALAFTSGTPMPQLPLIELQVSSLRIVGHCDPSAYPIHSKQAQSLEHLRDHLHLRTRTSTMAAVMRVRSRAQHAVHSFFQSEGFFNVHTPVLTPLDCEGAGEVFTATTSSDKPPSQLFFGRPMHLTVSGQLYAEMLACSLSKVYTFGPTFRAEQSNTTRHLNEFWMVEPELTYASLEQVMDLAERFVKRVVVEILKESEEDLRYFQSRFDPALLTTLAATCSSTPFVRVTYAEALSILRSAPKKVRFEFAPTWEGGLHSEHEKYLADTHFKAPVFITNYPRKAKPFYMRQEAASEEAGKETVRCFDLIIPGVGELIGGSEREERLEQLRANMLEHKLDPALYSWYLDLRSFGTVPHAGFGLGFERLLRFVTGMGNIRDLIPVPRTPGAAGGQF